MLKKTKSVAPNVMQKFRVLVDREEEKRDHELTETLGRLTVTAKNRNPTAGDPES